MNGGVLYENNDTIEIDIQQKINVEDVKIILADESNISALPTETNNLINGIQLVTLSVLFKVLNNDTETTQVAYYSAPSFGSRYNQTKMECFPNGILIKDIADTQEVSFCTPICIAFKNSCVLSKDVVFFVNVFVAPSKFVVWSVTSPSVNDCFLTLSNLLEKNVL